MENKIFFFTNANCSEQTLTHEGLRDVVFINGILIKDKEEIKANPILAFFKKLFRC